MYRSAVTIITNVQSLLDNLLKLFWEHADNENMEVSPRTTSSSFRINERGFTLPEVLITIVIMGILFAIASSSWQGVVEGRRVDSATNQLASDMRLAHTSATNQLKDHQIVVPAANSSTYQIGPSSGTLATRTIPDGTVIAAATTITFKPNGAAEVASGAGSPITVRSSTNVSNDHTIEFNTETSGIKIVS